MSTTAQQVFELAIHLMNEGDPATGETDTSDTKGYKSRTLAILNVLQTECLLCSDTFAAGTGARPICPPLAGFSTPIALDDGICRGLLPYGLAAHLLLDENAQLASFFNERYEQQKTALKNGIPRDFTAIEDSYGGIEFGRFAAW